MTSIAELRLRRTELKWVMFCAGSAFEGRPTHVDEPCSNTDLEATPQQQTPRMDIPVPTRRPALITPNILGRIIVIAWLSGLGGFSLVPIEHRVPTSLPWVLSVVLITNAVAWTTAIDVLCPARMAWYFRKQVPVPPVTCADTKLDRDDMALRSINDSPGNVISTQVALTTTPVVSTNMDDTDNITAGANQESEDRVRLNGIELLAGLDATLFCFLKLAFIQNDIATGWMDFVVALVGFALFVIKKCEALEWWRCCAWAKHWLFYENYLQRKYFVGCGRGIQRVIIIFIAWSTWWWIAYRLTSVVKVIRHRNDPHVRIQFIVLMCGMTAEAVGLSLTFFSYPICTAFGLKWRKQLWMSHLVATTSMAVFWLAAIVIGINTSAGTPCMLLPCVEESGSKVCKAMVKYLF